MTNTTTSTPKLTKSMKYDILLNIPAVAENDMLVEFINHEKELLAKKNISSTGEKKLTAVQKANEEIKTAILDCMVPTVEYTISDLIKTVPECADFNTSKVSALVKQLVVAEKVTRVERKGRAYFILT